MPCLVDAITGPIVDHVASLDRPSPTAKSSAFYNVPDTPICRRAEQYVISQLEPWAACHSFRTYAFALAIANYAGWDVGVEAQRLGFDKELIFLACVLHELGFNKNGDAQRSRLSLELWGAIKAREWILKQKELFTHPMVADDVEKEGRSQELLQEWADEACEAIARHTIEFRGFSSRVRLTTALVALGAGQDLMGLSVAFIASEDIVLICRRWPRQGYCQGLSWISKVEVAKKPACLFEDCVKNFDPQMFAVNCFKDLQGELTIDETRQWKMEIENLNTCFEEPFVNKLE